MKNFKILFSIAVASALVGCSSMAVDENEALEGNLPADFDVNEYMELHPELKRLQIKDYIAIHNESAEKAAKAAGTAAEFKTAKAADEAAFEADTATIHKIVTVYAGYSEDAWNLTLQSSTKDSAVVESKKDTVALGVKSKTEEGAKFVKVWLCPDSTNGGSIKMEADAISTVSAFADSICTGTATEYAAADYEFNLKTDKPAEPGLKVRVVDDTVDVIKVPVEGMVNPALVKAAKSYNFVDATNDLEKIAAIPLDLFAISYQYSAYGQDHGWAYRRCKEGDNLGRYLYELDPATLTYNATAEYPMTKLYCDDNGEPRELN